MKVEIRGKRHTFGEVVESFSFDEFKRHCESLKIFTQLPIKERNAKIKEVYGKYFGNVKKIPKSGHRSDIHTDNVKSDRRDNRTEQSADDGRKNIGRKEDKAKVQNKKIRSEETKTKF